MAVDWNKKLGFSVVALYRVGNYTDAALSGAILFERAVYFLLANKGIKKPDVITKARRYKKGELQQAIDLLDSGFNKNNLHDIRKNIRNNIIHNDDIHRINAQKILPMVQFVWQVFDNSSYIAHDNGDINKIDILTADYAVVEMREMLDKDLQDTLNVQDDFSEFGIQDFEDLLELRKKIITLGSKIKNEVLKIDYKDELYVDLISKVDTTSAYVWMPMSLHEENGTKLNTASVSLLATPLDLRIYLDIGGGAYQVRKDYYEFLQSGHFNSFWTKESMDEVLFFDNDWYCFIVQQKELSGLEDNQINKDAKNAIKKLDIDYNPTSKITWNKMLCGYIINRRNISFDEIKEKLKVIIKLYYCFEHYRVQVLKTSNIVIKYDINTLCDK